MKKSELQTIGDGLAGLVLLDAETTLPAIEAAGGIPAGIRFEGAAAAAFAGVQKLRRDNATLTTLAIQRESGLKAVAIDKLADAAPMPYTVAGMIADLKCHADDVAAAAVIAEPGDASFKLHELQRIYAPQIADAVAGGYPLILNAREFTAAPMNRPPEVVEGVLLQAGKLVYGGPSKAFKTWVLLDLCEAVATGGDWLGMHTTKGKTLYVNFELQAFSTHFRLCELAKARGHAVPENLHVWNLRGHTCALDRLLPELLKQIGNEGFSLIVLDPIYKALQGRDENGAGDIGEVCNEIEALAVRTGAAVAFGAHFAKGNASGKNAIDRIGGSGVFARDPDAILTATPHAAEGCFTLEMTLRDFAQPDPFAIRWQYPQMIRDGDLNPADLKQAIGRTPENDVGDILRHIGTAAISAAAWKKACIEDGMSQRTFFRLRKRAKDTRLVEQDGDNWTARKGHHAS